LLCHVVAEAFQQAQRLSSLWNKRHGISATSTEITSIKWPDTIGSCVAPPCAPEASLFLTIRPWKRTTSRQSSQPPGTRGRQKSRTKSIRALENTFPSDTTAPFSATN